MPSPTTNPHQADADVAIALRWLLGTLILLGLIFGLDATVWVALGRPSFLAPQHLAHAWWTEVVQLTEVVFGTTLLLLALIAGVFVPWLVGSRLIRMWQKVRHGRLA